MKTIIACTLFILACTATTGQNLPLLKVSDDRRYITTADGQPFFWLGGTAWELIHRLTKEEIDLYLQDRARKGFTVIQTVILAELDGLNTPNAYGHKPLINNDPARINEKYFELVDYVIKKAGTLGMYIGLLPTWGDKFNLKWGKGPVIFTPENAEVYGGILAKRYVKNNNIIWILGGDRMPETEEQYAIIRSMVKGIKKLDTRHLVTYHPLGGKKATDAFHEDWLDFDMFQSGHDRSQKEYNFVLESKKTSPARPVIEAEARYENSLDRFWEPGEHEWMDDSDVRLTAYWTMLAGAAGYTYGCHDIWQMYTTGREPVASARTDWKEALHLPGSQQMLYLKKLLLAFPWQKLVYDPTLILNKNLQDEQYIVSAMGKDRDFIIAYTPWGRPVQLNLPAMKYAQIEAFWYNPRSSKSVRIGNYNSNETPVFTPWAKGRGSDFVLIVKDKKANIRIPGL